MLIDRLEVYKNTMKKHKAHITHTTTTYGLRLNERDLNLFSTNIPYMEHHFHKLILAQWGLIVAIINSLLH